MPRQPASTALDHILVSDLTRVRSGLMAVRQLTDGSAGHVRIDEMFDDPQVQYLGIGQPLATAPLGDTRALGQPFQLSRTPSTLAASPPTRGQHTLEILEGLGSSAAEAADLQNKSVV